MSARFKRKEAIEDGKTLQEQDLNNEEVWGITIVEESLEKLIICFIIGISIVQQLEHVPVN
ncbi:hypothetical protein [Jeotgalibaca ciconiae]|uniref:Uncharacterized protein n=1 Tax=Jeotgalibaca ciconiae TaxID=2496265 RepID=A0A3Q9BIP1_9LACT|nr:hypothetical protein [Jeotgalibaca ciconiae]AZP03260.1 hypothetical protein EJN90_00475 [Jeotgalibaca ciconiae]